MDCFIEFKNVVKRFDDFVALDHVSLQIPKGSFVTLASQELMLEEKKKEVEADLEMAIRKGRSCGMSNQEITDLFQIVLEDQ